MADYNQFGSTRPTEAADSRQCAQCEAMLADAVDGSLTPEAQAEFDLHLLGCPACTEMLADAKRGATWMEILREHAPQPPAALLGRILAQTTGLQAAGSQKAGMHRSGLRLGGAGSATIDASGDGSASGMMEIAGAGSLIGADGAPSGEAGTTATTNLLPFRRRLSGRSNLLSIAHTLLQPRLAMTAAMAFFSIALTLNLTGVRVSELRPGDLRPSNLRRSMYQANAHVVRYVTNLREVYELESRVHDLQRSSDSEPLAAPAEGAQTQDGKSKPDGAAGQGGADGAGKKKDAAPESAPRRKGSPGTSRWAPLRDDLRVLAGVEVDQGGRPLLRRTPLGNQGAAPAGLPNGLKRATISAAGTNLYAQERGTV